MKKEAKIVDVLIPLFLPKAYSYLVPDNMVVQRGDLVSVMLGAKKTYGCVWSKPHSLLEAKIPKAKLKPILGRYHLPCLPHLLCDFIDFVSRYYLANKGLVLAQSLGVKSLFAPPKIKMGWQFASSSCPHKLTKSQKQLWDFLVQHKKTIFTISQLVKESGVGHFVIKTFIKQGFLVEKPLTENAKPSHKTFHFKPIDLSLAQKDNVLSLTKAIRSRQFKTYLLDGVTGSGKTEVYLCAILEVLKQKKQSLILLPEIALTQNTARRFEERFGGKVDVYHSRLSPSRRREIWHKVATKQTFVLMGARSALFLPFYDLGLLVVDEEHDGSFKQEDKVMYHARDMAVMRAKLSSCVCVLSSATASLESIANIKRNHYHHLSLPARIGQATLPEITLIDLRQHPPPKGCFISPLMVSALEEGLALKTQSLLFLNRRGYAPLTLCRHCGYRYGCKQCDAWLVAHYKNHILQCHQCGAKQALPERCDECGKEDMLAQCGPGVERIDEEVRSLFPNARVVILSSDNMVSPIAPQASQDKDDIFSSIAKGKIDIVIGTQIITKGHHFPFLSFVGVVDADLSLGGSDMRAGERTWQILTQVAGRAGRDVIKGRAFLQTHQPHHPVLQSLQNDAREDFVQRELSLRQAQYLPPFGQLAALILSHKCLRTLNDNAKDFATYAPHHKEITLLGPAPAPYARLRGYFRVRFLLKARRFGIVQPFLRQWLNNMRPHKKLRVMVDIDPYQFL